MTALEVIAATRARLVERGGTLLATMEDVIPDDVWYRDRPQAAVLEQLRALTGIRYLSLWCPPVDELLVVLDTVAGLYAVS